MNYKDKTPVSTQTANKQRNILSRLAYLHKKMKALEQSMQRERILIDYHIHAASHHIVRETDN